MRLSETKVAQLIESSPPKLVIVDDEQDEEITLDWNEVIQLLLAIGYFGQFLEGK